MIFKLFLITAPLNEILGRSPLSRTDERELLCSKGVGWLPVLSPLSLNCYGPCWVPRNPVGPDMILPPLYFVKKVPEGPGE